jgi:hypothetical protein
MEEIKYRKMGCDTIQGLKKNSVKKIKEDNKVKAK